MSIVQQKLGHVLIIEPDVLLGRVYVKALEEAGYSATNVTNAQTAVDSADILSPDVVILELQLVAHNGLEFLYEFRSYSDWQRVPVIIHSLTPQHAMLKTPELRYHLGVVNYLYKPTATLTDLIEAVHSVIKVTES